MAQISGKMLLFLAAIGFCNFSKIRENCAYEVHDLGETFSIHD